MIDFKNMPRIHSYMKSILEQHGHFPISIGGMPDHIHILLSYDIKENVDDMVRNVKAYTSKFINQSHITGCKFEWQRGYGCFSVSQEQLDTLKEYINNQQEHHKQRTFLQEYEDFLSNYQIDFKREYSFTPPL